MRDSAATRATRGSPIRVLMVGGTSADRAVLEREAGGRLAVEPAGDWAALASAARAGNHDAAVIDGRLGWASVRDVARSLKAADPFRPVILMAAATGEGELLEAARESLDDYVPVAEPDRLLVVLAACLARSNRALTDALVERQRTETAVRRSEARARFLVKLADAVRMLEKPDEIAQVTIRLLREALHADRCVYGDVDPGEANFTFTAISCAPGVRSVTGRFPVASFGGGVLAQLRSGKPLVVHDAEDASPAGVDPEAYRYTHARSLIIAPLVKGGRLAAGAGVHMLRPRRWTDEEVELVDLVAERLWEAMELARVSRALRESETEFRGLFELSAVGVAQVDPVTERFVRVNRRFCELTGYPEADLLRMTFNDITHPEDRARNHAAIDTVLGGAAGRWDIEKRYVRPDGSVVWVHVSGQLMPDASGRPYRLIANAVDVSDRKRAEEALLASRRQLQVVTDGAPVLLASCGADYRFEFVNKAYGDRLGLSPREVVGRLVSEVLGDEAFAQLKPHADRALRGERSEFEAEVHYRDLGTQWIRCAYAPECDDSGNVVGWVAAVINITDRKRAEQALREADRRKDEFLAVLGHELRNPLAPLRAGLELLKGAEHRPELLDQLRTMMERQLAHLIHLVDDLLDLSRISRGAVELQRARFDMHDVIEAALELGMPLITDRRHKLDVRRAAIPLPIEGDFQRLTQVLGNVLSNAAKYTETGGSISLSAASENGEAVVRVTDTGYGIPPEQLEDVFEMFSQVPEHRAKTGGGGIGIGLALSRQLVTLHGGSIEARSEGLGKGSEFIVRVPLAPADAEGLDRPSGSQHAMTPRRVLIVDDNVDAAESLRMVLERQGHDIMAVHSGPKALDAIESFDPEVVLLDIGLPEMDGYEVARRIRSRPGGESIALFASTGWAQEDDKRRARDAGFDGHLTKPVDTALLEKMIAEARYAPSSPSGADAA